MFSYSLYQKIYQKCIFKHQNQFRSISVLIHTGAVNSGLFRVNQQVDNGQFSAAREAQTQKRSGTSQHILTCQLRSNIKFTHQKPRETFES